MERRTSCHEILTRPGHVTISPETGTFGCLRNILRLHHHQTRFFQRQHAIPLIWYRRIPAHPKGVQLERSMNGRVAVVESDNFSSKQYFSLNILSSFLPTFTSAAPSCIPLLDPYLTSSSATFMIIRQGNKKIICFANVLHGGSQGGTKQKAILYYDKDGRWVSDNKI